MKQLKLNESTVSMVLGAIVIVVVGLLVINYFKGLEPGNQLPDGIATEQGDGLPTSHIVASGETLWDISEKYYNSGYNWIDIQDANNLTDPNAIEEGQSLVIPNVAPRQSEDDMVSDTAIPEPTETPVEETPAPTQLAEAMPAPSIPVLESPEIEGESYTVVRGDTLWDIAVRAYGNGYRWVDIARANQLKNPDLIHAGNVFILPR